MLELLGDLFSFLRERKKLWMAPLVVTLLLLGGLMIFAQTSALAPFLYTVF